MPNKFVCKFSVGKDRTAYASVWRVWTARNAPDLYIAVQSLSGELKATVHAPRPPDKPDWFRKFGHAFEAKSPVSIEGKKDGGPHKVTWTGKRLGPSTTLEYEVIIRGTSLDDGVPVGDDVVLLPIPGKEEQVHVAIFLGPQGPATKFPREANGESFLIGEGRLADDRQVWITYCIRPSGVALGTNQDLPPAKSSFMDPSVSPSELSGARLRATLVGDQPDGRLRFWDMKATLRPKVNIDG